MKFAVNSYSATTDRPSADGVSNPLVAWNETDRLLSADQDIYQNALRVLRAEAESVDGRLDIDTVPHFINKECTLTITPEKEDRPSGGHGTSVVYYPVNLVDSVESGSVSVNLSRTRSGQMVTVTVNPDEGYRAESVTVTDKNDKAVAVTDHQDGTYSFIMPASGVTIEPVFVREDEHTDRICLRDETCPMALFTDTDRQAWYHDGVHWAIENGIMHGTDENTFGPLTVTSRAMSVTTLWRMEGSPETDSSVTFEDVPEGMWYTDAVRWAAVNGIVTGYSAEEFCPADPVTREQLATILYRYVQKKGQGFAGTWAFPLNFSDADQVSEYAYEALCWMTMQGIVEGMDDHRLAPQEGTDRAQLATMLMRFDRLSAEH